jgi:hypothetical protein
LPKKEADFDDRGVHYMYQEFMQSWVGYKLVRNLHDFGLNPTIRQDLHKWALELILFFSCLKNKQGTSAKKNDAEKILSTLFNKTDHKAYFSKIPIKSKEKFAKLNNPTLCLVV